MINIFLDDLRACPDDFLCFRTGESLIAYLQKHPNQKYGIISFDHDLGQNIMDGYQVIRKIVNDPSIEFVFDEFRVHSDNLTGARNILRYLENACLYDAFPSSGFINPYKYNCINGEFTSAEYKL